MNIGTLVASIILDNAPLERSLRQAQAQVNSFSGLTASRFESLGKRIVSSLVGAFRTVMRQVTRIAGYLSALLGGGIFYAGIKAVNDYKVGVAALSALVYSFADKTKSIDLAGLYKEANAYARDLYVTVEQLAAQTMLTGEQANILVQEFVKAGVFIDTQNQKQINALKTIGNAVYTVTGGIALERQLVTEIGHLMMGQITAVDRLGKALLVMDPKIKEHIALWRSQGEVLEHLGELLKGFDFATEEIASSWGAVKTTLTTVVNQVLREGMKPVYQDLVGLIMQLNMYLVEHREEVGDKIVKAYEKLKRGVMMVSEVVQELYRLARLVLDIFYELWEVLKSPPEALLGFFSELRNEMSKTERSVNSLADALRSTGGWEAFWGAIDYTKYLLRSMLTTTTYIVVAIGTLITRLIQIMLEWSELKEKLWAFDIEGVKKSAKTIKGLFSDLTKDINAETNAWINTIGKDFDRTVRETAKHYIPELVQPKVSRGAAQKRAAEGLYPGEDYWARSQAIADAATRMLYGPPKIAPQEFGGQTEAELEKIAKKQEKMEKNLDRFIQRVDELAPKANRAQEAIEDLWRGAAELMREGEDWRKVMPHYLRGEKYITDEMLQSQKESLDKFWTEVAVSQKEGLAAMLAENDKWLYDSAQLLKDNYIPEQAERMMQEWKRRDSSIRADWLREQDDFWRDVENKRGVSVESMIADIDRFVQESTTKYADNLELVRKIFEWGEGEKAKVPEAFRVDALNELAAAYESATEVVRGYNETELSYLSRVLEKRMEMKDTLVAAKETYEELGRTGEDGYKKILGALTQIEEVAEQVNTLSGGFIGGFKMFIDEYMREINDAFLQGYLSAQKMIDGMGSALTDFFDYTSDGFMDWRNLITNILHEIYMELIRVFVVQKAMGIISGAITGLFPSKGADLSQVQMVASGGPVAASRPYIVGEEGPELFVPRTPGMIVPNDELRGMGEPRAEGGDVLANRLYRVGERGPELFIPSPTEQDARAEKPREGDTYIYVSSLDVKSFVEYFRKSGAGKVIIKEDFAGNGSLRRIIGGGL